MSEGDIVRYLQRGHISSTTIRKISAHFENKASDVHKFLCVDPEGGHRGPDPHLKNHKNIGFLSNIGPDPL